MTTPTTRNLFQKTFITLFIIGISAPALWMTLLPAEPWSITEKRKLAELPSVPVALSEVPEFFSKSEQYLLDHFGFRDFLIMRYYREIKKRFGISGMDSRVLLGNDGWFYYIAEGQLEDYLGKSRLSKNQLKEWIKERNRRYQWLKQRNIEYLLIIPPGKQTIYPEHLPDGLGQINNTSRLDQLVEYHNRNPLPYLLLLQEPLLHAKSTSQPLYYKSDTHWNLRGGYIAFSNIIKVLEEKFPDASFHKNFSFGPDVIRSCETDPTKCDLARMTMQHTDTSEAYATIEEYNSCVRPHNFNRYGFTNLQLKPDTPSFASGCKQHDLSALIFRDSFFVALHPFMQENFKHAVYLWKDYDQSNIEEFLKIATPDIVIEEVAERHLFETIE